MRRVFVFALLLLSGLVQQAWADDLLMVRSRQSFPEAMLTLQQSIIDHDYQVSRVQRVDIGLTAMGYETDKYRVVFMGRLDELQALSSRHPELIPYLPMKIAIFAEEGQTMLVTTNPIVMAAIYPDPELAEVFERWSKDLKAILQDVRDAE